MVAEKGIRDAVCGLGENFLKVRDTYNLLLEQNVEWHPRHASTWIEINLIESSAISLIRKVTVGEDVGFALLSWKLWFRNLSHKKHYLSDLGLETLA